MMPVYSYIYSVPYLFYAFFLIVLSLCEFNHKMARQTIRNWCIVSFILFFGFRGFVSWDWINYYPLFESVETIGNIKDQGWLVFIGDSDGLSMVEPGYVLYMSLIKSVWDNWHFFVLVSTLIDIIVFDKFINRFSPFYAFSILMFIVFSMGMEFNVLRNTKAIVVFLLSLDAIYQRNWCKLFIFSLLGFSFHNSYLVYVLFYFVGTKDFGTKIWWFIFISCNIFYWTQISVFSSILMPLIHSLGGVIAQKVEFYSSIDIYSMARGFSLGYIMRIITFILIVCNYRRIISLNKKLILILNVYLLYFITNVGLTDMSVFCDRMEISLGFSMWILYPILGLIYQDKNRLLFLAFIFTYSMLRVPLQRDNVMEHYENILFGADDYETRLATHVIHASEIQE